MNEGDNVIFDTTRKNVQSAKRALEEYLRTAVGYPVRVFLRTVPDLAAIAARGPFPEREYSWLLAAGGLH